MTSGIATRDNRPGMLRSILRPCPIGHGALRTALFALVLAFVGAVHAEDGGMRDADRRRLQVTLDRVVKALREDYYDPSFGGRDLDALASTARERIASATAVDQAISAIAQLTLEFDDSHTFFLPPFRTIEVDYGLEIGIVGANGMVLEVDPGSDAEKQGVHKGDVVERVNGFEISRDTLWKVLYLLGELRPQPGLHLELATPDGARRELDIAAKVHRQGRVLVLEGEGAGHGWARLQDAYSEYAQTHRTQLVKAGDDVLIVRMRTFGLADDEPKRILEAARGRETLILDLRGNPGGPVAALRALTGALFADDVEIATFRERDETRTETAHGRGKAAFDGRLLVLVDAQSASASELLARTVQLRHRGQVLGQRSAGSVMVGRSIGVVASQGDYVVASEVNVTVADVVMSDGRRLEKAGVIPDVIVVPTPGDVAAGRDPVLARALSLAGHPVDAAEAGALLARE